ncbi:hypothetical protein J4476_00425 [Candidatus Woesearchaeota archaeon]|nr:hypothetical protein [Candidatus Woesearchaeota archaeon]HIH26359.1 hypothetical protein [Nanoarchaeota archaeon]
MRIGRLVGLEVVEVNDSIVNLLTSNERTSIDIGPETEELTNTYFNCVKPLGIYHPHEGRYINIDGRTYEIDVELEILRVQQDFTQIFRHLDKIPINRRYLVLGTDSEVLKSFETYGYVTDKIRDSDGKYK